MIQKLKQSYRMDGEQSVFEKRALPTQHLYDSKHIERVIMVDLDYGVNVTIYRE